MVALKSDKGKNDEFESVVKRKAEKKRNDDLESKRVARIAYKRISTAHLRFSDMVGVIYLQ